MRGSEARRPDGKRVSRGDVHAGVARATSRLPVTLRPCDPDTLSCQDRNGIERPHGQRLVALDPRGAPSLFLCNTLGEQSPGTFLVELDCGIDAHPRRSPQYPMTMVA